MPQAADTHKGSSIRRRAARAAQMTREQTAERNGRTAGQSQMRAVQSGAPKAAALASRKTSSGKSRASGNTQKRPVKRKAHAEGVERAKSTKTKKAKEEPQRTGTARFVPHGKTAVLLGVVAFVVIAAAVVYSPAKAYYVSVRDNQRLEAQLAAVEACNDQIAASNEELDTDEGIEDQARTDYGYVMEGDESAMVTNLDENSSPSSVTESIDLDAIEAPQTWYYTILDAVFSYNS